MSLCGVVSVVFIPQRRDLGVCLLFIDQSAQEERERTNEEIRSTFQNILWDIFFEDNHLCGSDVHCLSDRAPTDFFRIVRKNEGGKQTLTFLYIIWKHVMLHLCGSDVFSLCTWVGCHCIIILGVLVLFHFFEDFYFNGIWRNITSVNLLDFGHFLSQICVESQYGIIIFEIGSQSFAFVCLFRVVK